MANLPTLGKQLGQLRPADTNAASLYSPGANVVAEITLVVVANTGAGGVTYRLFHDEDGTTYNETTALAWDETVTNGENKFVIFDRALWMSNSAGNLAVRTNTANDATFTVYGVEHRE